jgi:hypothetical protein
MTRIVASEGLLSLLYYAPPAEKINVNGFTA